MDKNVEKELRIKTGVLRRAVKELQMYEQEVVDGRKKLEEMGTGHDRYKQTRAVLDESIGQVSDTKNRLQDAADDMHDLMGEHSAIFEANEDHELVKEARKWISEADAAEEGVGDAAGSEEDF